MFKRLLHVHGYHDMGEPNKLNFYDLDPNQAGVRQFAYLSPHEPVCYVHPAMVAEALEQYGPFDYVLLDPTPGEEFIDAMVACIGLCREQHLPLLCTEGPDVHFTWQKTTDNIARMLKVISLADAFLYRHDVSKQLVSALLDIPMFPFWDVSSPCTLDYRDIPKREGRNTVCMPFPPDARPNAQRNDMVNSIILKGIHDRHPDLRYCVISGAPEPDSFLEGLGVPFEYQAGKSIRRGIVEVLRQSLVFVNMDFGPVVGQFNQDACATGTPLLVTNLTGIGHMLNVPLKGPYDIEGAVELACEWIEVPDVWIDESARVKAMSKKFSAQEMIGYIDTILETVG